MDRTTAEQMLLVNSPPCFFRPPAGSYDANTLALAQARGMSVWNWSVDTGDWKAEGSGSAEWVERIADLAEAGADQAHPVILMHDSPGGSPATVAALPRIIQFYRDRGYTFVDLAGRSAGRLPFGYLDSARETSAGHVTVQGWAIDPDLPTQAVAVHVYVDGVGQAVVADQVRPDVGDAHPSAGPAHGFTAAFDMSPGVHRVCVFAIDTAAADDHTDLGCRNVVAPRG
jgi:hypothetical protein